MIRQFDWSPHRIGLIYLVIPGQHSRLLTLSLHHRETHFLSLLFPKNTPLGLILVLPSSTVQFRSASQTVSPLVPKVVGNFAFPSWLNAAIILILCWGGDFSSNLLLGLWVGGGGSLGYSFSSTRIYKHNKKKMLYKCSTSMSQVILITNGMKRMN